MMNNRFLKYIVCIAILIIVDQVLGSLISSLAKKQIRDNRIGLLLDGKVDAEIVVVGSSRALNNYDPQVISKITGKKTYNFGVSGSNILFHENIIDLLLNSKNKPETIIYNIDDYGALFENSNIIYRKDVLFPYVDNPLINEMIAGQLKKPLIATFFSKTYRQNVNFINAIKFLVYGRENPDYKTTNFDEFGSNLLVQRAQDPVPSFNAVGYNISGFSQVPEYVSAFKNIQMKCRANNVKLILSLPPLYAANSKGFKEMISNHTLQGTPFFDFTGGMQDAAFFFNPDHMNSTGAKAFSVLVGEKIIQTGQ